LALLDEIPGVQESRVDHSGKFILLEIQPGADAEQILIAMHESLDDARRVEPTVESQLVASFRRGDTWLRAGDTMQLSREEAHILAHRAGVEAAQEMGLDAQHTEKLLGVVESELTAAFERIQAAGKGLDDAARSELRGIGERVVERSRAFLAPEQIETLEAYNARRLNR
jgi:hypothetical protein